MDNKTFIYDKRPLQPQDLEIPKTIKASVKVLSGANEGRVFAITKSAMVLGRGEQADIVIDDESMSRRHVEITYRNLEFRLKDLDSSNGTFLNGSEVKEYALRNGDKIMAGETVLLFGVERVTG